MDKKHPHSDASYRIFPLDGIAFAVEVVIPDMSPTTISFPTEADANSWVEKHKSGVASGETLRRRFYRSAKH